MAQQPQWRPVRGYAGLYEVSDWGYVREMRAAGLALTDLGALFGVHYSTVGYICQNKTWRENGRT